MMRAAGRFFFSPPQCDQMRFVKQSSKTQPNPFFDKNIISLNRGKKLLQSTSYVLNRQKTSKSKQKPNGRKFA
jgi:hypothetical protein